MSLRSLSSPKFLLPLLQSRLLSSKSSFLEPQNVVLGKNDAVGVVSRIYPSCWDVFVTRTHARNGVKIRAGVKGSWRDVDIIVGDKVLLKAVEWDSKRGKVEYRFERDSLSCHPPVANVNEIFLVFSASQELKEELVTKYLVEAESTRLNFSVLLNSHEAPQSSLKIWEKTLFKWGYVPTIFSTAKKLHGLKNIMDKCEGGTKLLMGPPQSGKCRIFQSQVSMDTIPDCVLLMPSEAGYLVHFPSRNPPRLLDVTARALGSYFRELPMNVNCKFKNCLHAGEEGCAVSGAGWERYPVYLKLLKQLQKREAEAEGCKRTKEDMLRVKTGPLGVMEHQPKRNKKPLLKSSRRQLNQSLFDDSDNDS